jgi:hypothetical protein
MNNIVRMEKFNTQGDATYLQAYGSRPFFWNVSAQDDLQGSPGLFPDNF